MVPVDHMRNFRTIFSCDHRHSSTHLDPGGERSRGRLGALSAVLCRLQLPGQLPGLGGQLRRLLCLVARIPSGRAQLCPQLLCGFLRGILLSLLPAKAKQLCSWPTFTRRCGTQQCSRKRLYCLIFKLPLQILERMPQVHLAQAVTDKA